MTEKASPPSKKIKNCVWAFCVGGFICSLGQALRTLFEYLGLSETEVAAAVSVSLIFIAAVLTGLKVFDKIARYAGAGTLVPITGFANAVVSPAIEFRQEGHIVGIGARMFGIAGPVIVFGTIASVLYGLILWIFRLV
ncbi:MAG TPA: stage V sporulation protein AC [Ruminococcaceae bacterium]|nr:stage V sporulation protein AC [Oscillospiraceae bacterium]